MCRLGLIGVLLLLVSGCSSSGDPGGPRADEDPPPAAVVAGDTTIAVARADGTEGSAILHAPDELRGGPAPLVLVFHGSPGSPQDVQRASRFDAVADDNGFLVAYPDSFERAEDVAALLDEIVEQYPVDERRVYAAGFSRGAATTYLLADELAGRIAAFAPVSGLQYGVAPEAPAPLITFQGGLDPLSSGWASMNREWAGAAGCRRAAVTDLTLAGQQAHRAVAACRGGSEHVVYSVERMGHEWPRAATRLIWDFFAAHALAR